MILFQFLVIYGTKFNEHKLAWTSCTFSYSSEASLAVGNGSGLLFFCQLLAHFFRFLSSYMGIFCKLTLILSDWCWSQGIFAITASCLLIHGARKVYLQETNTKGFDVRLVSDFSLLSDNAWTDGALDHFGQCRPDLTSDWNHWKYCHCICP